MVVVLCLDNGNRHIGFVKQQIVGTLLLATGNHLAANNDATIRECILATPLMIRPTRSS